MGKIVKPNQPCINDDCSSSDGRQVYEDGSSFCFVCQKYFKKGTTAVEKETPAPVKNNYVKGPTTAEEVRQFPIQAIGRGIDKAVCEFYEVRVGFGSDGKVNEHYYPYEGDAYKVRKIPKAFYSIGKCKTLFGKERFQGGGKRVVITEGEVDTLSVAQAYMKKYGKIYPVVSLPSAKAFADVALLANRDWLRSFSEVVLCLDNDEAGNEIQAKAIKIIGVDKVKICKLPVKDANKMLTEHGPEDLLTKIWDAERFIPSGVIDKDKLWAALEEYNSLPSVPYPECLGGLNEKLKGMREGEISLFISGTGAGKSTMQREIMLHILQTTEAKIGIVSLEEAPAETARKLSGMQLLRNPADEEIPLPELKVGFDAVFGSDRVLLLDHQGSMNDDSITEKLEYMCLMGCKYLFIDHITILVSEGTEGLSGNEAIDKIMNTMQRIVKRHPTWIGLISHLRKAPVGGKSFEEGKLPSVDDIKGCLAYNTGVIRADGKIAPVQDIVEGDILMGDDGSGRRVISIIRGEQQMYKVTMKTSGDSFICNADHILTLSYNGNLFDIKLIDFLDKGESFRYRCKQHYSEGYELHHHEMPIPPYALGAWLGDGSKSAFRIMDASGLGIAQRVAGEICAVISAPNDVNREYFNFDTGTRGEMLDKLKALNLYCNKHIPDGYIYTSKKARLELLAGLIDTDGTYSPKDNAYYFYQKDVNLADSVRYIARSLGLYSNVRVQEISGDYRSKGDLIFVVTISGNIERIPAQKSLRLTRKSRKTDALKRGIAIEKLDTQPYYGFLLDGNGRFLLDNHIITHNSGSIKQISFDIVSFARDMTADDDMTRNTIKMRVLKCRHTGLTGTVRGAYYNYKTGRLVAASSSPEEDFQPM